MPFAMSSASISRKTGTPGLQLRYRFTATVTLPWEIAARLAGVNRFKIHDILREEGVELRVGPEDMTAARDEIEAARDLE